MNVVDRDCGTVRAQGRYGGIAEPGGLFDQRARAIVLAQQVTGFVISVKDGAGGAAADLDALAEGIVDRCLGGGAVGQGFEAPGVVVGGADRGVAGGVACSVVAVRAGQRPGDSGDPIARGCDRVGGGGGAALGQAVAVGVIGPAAGSAGARAAGDPVEGVIVF